MPGSDPAVGKHEYAERRTFIDFSALPSLDPTSAERSASKSPIRTPVAVEAEATRFAPPCVAGWGIAEGLQAPTRCLRRTGRRATSRPRRRAPPMRGGV